MRLSNIAIIVIAGLALAGGAYVIFHGNSPMPAPPKVAPIAPSMPQSASAAPSPVEPTAPQPAVRVPPDAAIVSIPPSVPKAEVDAAASQAEQYAAAIRDNALLNIRAQNAEAQLRIDRAQGKAAQPDTGATGTLPPLPVVKMTAAGATAQIPSLPQILSIQGTQKAMTATLRSPDGGEQTVKAGDRINGLYAVAEITAIGVQVATNAGQTIWLLFVGQEALAPPAPPSIASIDPGPSRVDTRQQRQ